MTDDLGEQYIRILIYLYEGELYKREWRSGSLTQLADILEVSKTAASRALDKLEEQGMIRRDSARRIELNGYGKKAAKDYYERSEKVRAWMQLKGVTEDTAEAEALPMILNVPQTVASAVLPEMQAYGLRQRLQGKKVLSGKEFCAALDEGDYPVNFFFYRGDSTIEHVRASMVNEGFERPATLRVKRHEGTLILKARPIKRSLDEKSPPKVGVVCGIGSPKDSSFKSAQGRDYCFRVPVQDFEFIDLGGANLYQGRAVLHIYCLAGPEHVSESDTILVMAF
jgi:Mn-dependent DtxR family transcriptional regulator